MYNGTLEASQSQNYKSSTNFSVQRQFNPEIVFFSESHWSSSFNVRFRSYHILKKDRAQRMGGGVALLIHKSVQFLPLKCYSSNTVEAIGATILTKNTGNIDVISVYVPKGNWDTE